MTTTTQSTWAEVSLPRLRQNFAILREVAGAQAALAVVKADAYGHGAVPCASALQEEGARWFGVTSCAEGVRLREAGIRGSILILSGFWEGDGNDNDNDDAEAILRHSLTPAVWNATQVGCLNRMAQKMGRPSASVPVHIKVDTGMSRLGARSTELPELVAATAPSNPVFFEGVFSHFASSENAANASMARQLLEFESALSDLRRLGIQPAIVHMANSAAVFTCPMGDNPPWGGARVLVRLGLALYGYLLELQPPLVPGERSRLAGQLKPVLSWKTRMISKKEVSAGRGVGYGPAYTTKAATQIGVLPVGYADGFSRKLAPQGKVIVRGKFADIVGNVSMDLTMIDVTGIPGATVGDEVTLIGSQGDKTLSAWDHARWAGTIPYEILCAIGKRVPRIY